MWRSNRSASSFGALGRARFLCPRARCALRIVLRHALLLVTMAVVGYAGYITGNYSYGVRRQGADWLFSQLIPAPVVASNIRPASFAPRASALLQNVWLVEEDDNGGALE